MHGLMVCGIRTAKARVLNRVDRLSLGNPGDVKSIGSGVSELRIDYGPGYRLYFTKRGAAIVCCFAAVTSAPRPRTSSVQSRW